MTDFVVSLKFNADGTVLVNTAKQAAAATAEIGKAGKQAGSEASQGFNVATSSATKLKGEIGSVRDSMLQLVAAFGGLSTIKRLTSSFIEAADAHGQLDARMRRVSESAGEQAHVMSRLHQIANDAYVSTSSLVEIYVRSIDPLRQLGGTTQTALDLTEALSLSMVVSATAADKRAVAIDALSRVMQTGVAKTQQFESILNSAPRFVEALEVALGKTRSELYEMASAGTLTALEIAKVGSQINLLRDEVQDMPTTVEDAVIRFSNAFMSWAGSANEASGATGALVEVIDTLSNNISTVMQAAFTAAGIGLVIITKQGMAWAASLVQQGMAARAAAVEALNKAKANATEAAQSLAAARAAVAHAEAMRNAAMLTGNAAAASAQLAAARQAEAVATARAAASNEAFAVASANARSGVLSLNGALNLLMAAFAGWQIGQMMRERFQVVEQAGIALMSGLMTQAERMKFFFVAAFEAIKAAALGAINVIRQAASNIIGAIASVNEATDVFGIKGGLTEKLRDMQTSLAPTSSALDTFKGKLIDAVGAMREKITAIDDGMFANWEYAASSREASAAIAEFEQTGVVSTQAVDAALRKLTGALAEQDEKMKEQIATYGKGKVGALEYAQSLEIAKAATIADASERQRYIDGIKAAYAPLIANARALDGMTSSSKKTVAAQRELKDEVTDFIGKLREQVATYGMSEEAKQRYQLATMKASDAQRAEAESLIDLIARRKEADAALEPARRAVEELARGHADLDEELARMADRLTGLDEKQVAYNAAVREQNRLMEQALLLGEPTAAMQEEHAKRLERLRDLLNMERAIESQDAMREAARRAAEDSTRSWENFAGDLANAIADGSRGVKQLWKRMIDDMKRQLIQSGLMALFRNLFGLGGGGGFQMAGGGGGLAFGSLFTNIGSGLMSGIGGGGGGGNLANTAGTLFNPSRWMDAGRNMWQGFQSGWNGTAGNFAGHGGMAGWAGAAGGALYGMRRGDGRLGTVGSTLAGGVAGYYAGGVAAGAMAGGMAGAGAAMAAIPIAGWIAAAAMVIDMISGGRLFGTKFRPESSTSTLSLSGQGGTASASIREVRQRALFGGRAWRSTDVDPGDEAREAAQQLFENISAVMADSARALAVETPPMIEAALRTVTEYDKKGRVKATKIFVDVIGRTWEEATAELAATRLSAEAIIATIDTAFDQVATAIAERWRDDAEKLMDGAQFLLAAASDIRAGLSLLGEGATLGGVVDLVESMARAGESLTETYARISTATALLDQALGMSGVSIDATREQIIRLASDIADAAGGIENAQGLWQSYFDNFYSAAERAAYAAQQRQATGQMVFSGIGLNLSDYTGEGGMAAFRRAFEDALPTLSAEQIAQWLRAADALAAITEASRQIDAALADNDWQLYLDGLSDHERAVAETMRRYDDMRETLLANGASVEQLARLEEQRATAMERVRAAAQAEYDDIMQSVSDEYHGISDFARQMREIDRWAQETTRRLHETAVAAGRQGAAESDLAMVHGVAAQRAAAAIAELRASAASLVGELFGPAAGSLDAINARIAQIEAQAGGRGGFGGVSQAIDRTIDTWMNGIAKVRGFLDDILLNRNLTTLTPQQRLAEAQAQYDALLAAAQGGDANALASLPEAARSLLEFARDYWSSGDEYQDIFDTVRQQLEAVTQQAPPATATQPEASGYAGGGGVSQELSELYAQRDAMMAEREAEHRQQMMNQLAGMVRELIEATGQPLAEVASSIGLNLREMAEGLGINLNDMSQSTALALVDMARRLGVDVSELAQNVGVSLGSLADRQSLLNQALDATMQDIPAEFRERLQGPLDAIRNATSEADANDAIRAMDNTLDDMPGGIRDLLAPYFQGISPTPVVTELTRLSDINSALATANGHLSAIAGALQASNRANDIQAYAAGGWVNRPTEILAGEAGRELILPNSISEFFVKNGIPINPAGGSDSELRALREEVRQLRFERLRGDAQMVAASNASGERVSAQIARQTQTHERIQREAQTNTSRFSR